MRLVKEFLDDPIPVVMVIFNLVAGIVFVVYMIKM